MANVRKLGYFKPVKQMGGAWDRKNKARPRAWKPGKENANGKALGKRIRPA